MESRSYLLVLFSCVLFIASSSSLAAQVPVPAKDMLALLAFQAEADGNSVLNTSWDASKNPNPCSDWKGIECDGNSRVKNVLLNGVGLRGTFAATTLSQLSALLVLDLSNNVFTGAFPTDLSDLTTLIRFRADNSTFSGAFPNITTNTGLVQLRLSDNNLTGSISDLSGLSRLATVDLSRNNFSGPFPSLSVSDTKLSTLDLSHNNFQDLIPDLSSLTGLKSLDLSVNSFGEGIPALPSSLTSLNLSNNSLNGSIPSDLAKFGKAAFEGNLDLCGPPLDNRTSCGPASGSGSPTSSSDAGGGTPPNTPPSNGSTLTTRDIAFIVVGALAVVFFLALCIGRYLRTRDRRDAAPKGLDGTEESGPMAMTAVEKSDKSSKLSFFDHTHDGYDLEDLLRASAEMLGKGSFGTAYKAVMESGLIVAVKRLKDARDMSRKDFDQHMEVLGRLRHPNLVPLRAYYYAKEEKLLIYDFMPNGSLSSLLHGSRGPARTPLEWPARLTIAQGVAQGLTYLHQQGDSHKIVHGNLKSSNILTGKNFEVCISDFGLVPLMPSSITAQRMAGYRAPECHYPGNHARKITYKADVYSFGVLLLELLTGRQPAISVNDNGLDLPKWVHSMVREEWTGEVFDLELKSYLHGEEEMVTLLQIAMSCVDSNPNQRPEMASVVDQLDAIGRGQSLIDDSESQSHSPEGEADYSKDADFSKDYSKDYSRDYSDSQDMPSTS